MATELLKSLKAKMSMFNKPHPLINLYIYSEHVEWVRAYTGAVLELQEYVKTYHITGLQWNPDVINNY